MTGSIRPDDILVTIDHPFGEIEVPLAEWIREGPGPRPRVQLKSARRASTGEAIPLDDIDDPWRRTDPPPSYPGLRN